MVFDWACSGLSLRELFRFGFGGGDLRRGDVGQEGEFELEPIFEARSCVPSNTPFRLAAGRFCEARARWIAATDGACPGAGRPGPDSDVFCELAL